MIYAICFFLFFFVLLLFTVIFVVPLGIVQKNKESESVWTLFFVYFLDAVIIGASSVKQLKENLQSTKNGPLHEGMYAVEFSFTKGSDRGGK